MIELSLLILAFIVLSGCLTMIDTALLSVSMAEVQEAALAGKKGARALARVMKSNTRGIIVIVIFTSIVAIAGPLMIGRSAERIFDNRMIGFMTVFLAFLSIIFIEILPKAIGAHYAPTIARSIAPFVELCIILFFPVVVLLEKLTRLFKRGRRKIGTEQQIMALANIGEGAGHIAQSEEQLIKRAFILHDHKTKDIMTPLKNIVALPMNASIRYGAKMIFHHSYSRYPLFGKSINDIQGLALSRDILEALAEGKDFTSLQTIRHESLIVHPDMLCNHLLSLFRKKQIHLAVVQKNGKTVGIVTLEDVLEELVGEIEDEGDTV